MLNEVLRLTKNKISKNLVYSLDEEYYYDIDEIADMLEDRTYIHVAEKVTYTHKDFIDLSDLIEWMIDRAYDEAGDWAESYLNDLTNKKAEELELKIVDLFNKLVRQPKFFTVKNVKQISIEEFYQEHLGVNK